MTKFKTISSIGLVGFLGLIVYLFWQIDNLKDVRSDQAQELHRVHWLLDAKERENDVLRDFGKYSIPDTAWDSIPIPYPVHDTLPPDTFYAQIPKIWGYFKIDTVVGLGLKTNPLYVRVKGRVYHPEEYSGLNWLKVYQDSLDSWEAPYLPSEPSQTKRWGLGLSYLRSFNRGSQSQQSDYFGGSVRYKRITLTSSYDPWQKRAMALVGIEVLGF